MFSFQFINIESKLYFYKCTHFFLLLYLSGYNSSISLLYGDYHPTMITLIPRIPTLIPRIPIIPILIPRIPINPTLIPRIPTLISGVHIIPVIPFPDSPFRLLQIDRLKRSKTTNLWTNFYIAIVMKKIKLGANLGVSDEKEIILCLPMWLYILPFDWHMSLLVMQHDIKRRGFPYRHDFDWSSRNLWSACWFSKAATDCFK